MTGPSRNTEPGSPPRMPRWVKVAAVVVGALVLLLLVLRLTGLGGEHGPGRHASGGASSPAGVAPQDADASGHRQW